MGTMASVPDRIEAIVGSRFTRRNQNEAASLLIVSADPQLRNDLSEAIDGRWSRIQSATGADSAKRLLAFNRIAACLCGFELEDGSYRDVVKFAKRQNTEIPVIIVSTPNCPNEYREYLAAMNAGAFDFLCYPYQKREVERMLGLAVRSFHRLEFSRHF
jgi:DNA-binding NtrC family response regulator